MKLLVIGLCVFVSLIVLCAAAPPAKFDGRVTYGSCIGAVLNGGQCAGEMNEILKNLATMVCIKSKRPIEPLSSTYINSCCGSKCGGACSGGEVADLFKFLVNNGTVTEKCSNTTTRTCPSTCSNGSPLDKVKIHNLEHPKSIADIQTAIYEQGPVLGIMDASEASFEEYSGGVYKCSSANPTPDHLVSIVGWVSTDDANTAGYWIAQNSWGVSWGMQGYFLLDWTKDCGIHNEVTVQAL
eukprot:TRINITY_DN3491_c0_g1_i1.p1 TRINITY_DN3491_c0_g1~~TRINITY_DN3491_c0_g1_i1.p1  ORF type:complete len:254 (-),score=33.97 TRINITY_DN3491_c0_g1_i1:45-764(-)